MKPPHTLRRAIVLVTMLTAPAAAQTPATDDSTKTSPSADELARLKQNPVSGLRQLLFTANATSHVPHTNQSEEVYSLQAVWPFALNDDWRLITYTIVPFLKVPSEPPGSSVSGVGNTVFNAYVSPQHASGNFVWGFGPAVLLPTRSKDELGSNRFGLGPAGILFYSADAWSAGVVLQNLWSIDASGPNRVNEFGAQYLFNYNFSGGWFLYSNQTILSDWTAESGNRWTVPVGIGAGRIFNIGSQPVSVSLQAYVNVVKPDSAPERGLNFQFAFLFP